MKTKWTDKTRDLFYNDLLSGRYSKRGLATKYGVTEKAVGRQIDVVMYLEEQSIITSYRPSKYRVDRKGLRWVRIEEDIALAHARVGVSPKITARFLMRDETEIRIFLEGHKIGRRRYTAKLHSDLKERRAQDHLENDEGWEVQPSVDEPDDYEADPKDALLREVLIESIDRRYSDLFDSGMHEWEMEKLRALYQLLRDSRK